jgi:nitrous oxide reductase accessory protein NosL
MNVAAAILAAGWVALAAPTGVAGLEPIRPAPRDKCPVCGMFVARYPDWVAGIRFQDGSHAVFDGAKDLFRFLLSVEDYGPAGRRKDVAAILVTDYYSVRQVDAREAWFVVGSDVLGPMGHELVPFARREEAEEFLRDHHGKRLVRFAEVNPSLLRALE